jgi:hypothetical protein
VNEDVGSALDVHAAATLVAAGRTPQQAVAEVLDLYREFVRQGAEREIAGLEAIARNAGNVATKAAAAAKIAALRERCS